MLLLALSALLLQAQDTVPIYDSTETRDLVERAILVSAEVPAELTDYRAVVQSSLFTAISADSVAGGDLPASVDELVSEVRWSRDGALHQRVEGHRTRLSLPLPYTLATILQSPWVVPHLYGSSIFTPLTGPGAVNPFGMQGPRFYRYAADDPVRIRVQNELVTLVPVAVRPRLDPDDETSRLVVGTFYLDVDRAAVARARFGFVGSEGGFPATFGRVHTYFELENALWEGRYWLPFQQRREHHLESSLLGGAVAARIVNRFVDYDFNTGWTASGPGRVLEWDLQGERAAFSDWPGAVGADAGRYSTLDFSDLRLATAAESLDDEALRVQLHYERGAHLFRYNRVEGAYLGVGGRLIPPDPRTRRWEVYGTAGWAFAEETPRGELSARWGAAAAPDPATDTDWGAEATAYRRLVEILPFRRTYTWDWLYSLPAALWGSDEHDWYAAEGVEAFAQVQRGRWSARLGGRWERQDSSSLNTTRFLFGEASEFGPLASTEPGTHLALEGGGGYTLGPGAFGVGNSLVARVDGEAGLGDFGFQRVTALLSTRVHLGPVTLAARADAGHVQGDAPPQRLFRFGSVEGLRGYEPDEFGGSSAVLGRSRMLVWLPPRSSRPLARIDFLLIPPLRPALVLLAETGYTRVDDRHVDALGRLGARPTDGWRSALGAGLSILDDTFTFEYLHPVGNTDGQESRWYAGMTYWY